MQFIETNIHFCRPCYRWTEQTKRRFLSRMRNVRAFFKADPLGGEEVHTLVNLVRTTSELIKVEEKQAANHIHCTDSFLFRDLSLTVFLELYLGETA